MRLIDPKSNIKQIYKKNQILKIKDIIKLELSKFGYKYLHNILPTRIKTLFQTDHRGKTLAKLHPYRTRNKNIINNPPATKDRYNRSFLNKGLTEYNELPLEIKK